MFTSAGDTSVELEDHLVNEWLIATLYPLVALGRPQLVSASCRPQLLSGIRLHARLGQPWNMVVGVTISCLILDEM